jgi:hypothetical protein
MPRSIHVLQHHATTGDKSSSNQIFENRNIGNAIRLGMTLIVNIGTERPRFMEVLESHVRKKNTENIGCLIKCLQRWGAPWMIR